MKRNKSEIKYSSFYRKVELPPLLSREEELTLARVARDGSGQEKEDAIEKMILANLRLVIRIAHNYSNCGIEIDDLINEGNMGLMKAARRFDPDKGVKFSTYSSYWIKQKILRYLCNHARAVRLPVHLYQKARRVFKFIDSYKHRYNERPSNEVILDEVAVTPRELEKILISNFVYIHLEAHVADKEHGGNSNETRNYLDVLADEEVNAPDAVAIKSDNIEIINKFLDSLPERERFIMEHRFGLNNKDTYTLEKIGEEFGVTRERIRQIEFAMMKKARFLLNKTYSTGLEVI
tara:strand:+ start:76 stop:951 length:876 start_codon:yes stop_codon:yes gene_type:complete